MSPPPPSTPLAQPQGHVSMQPKFSSITPPSQERRAPSPVTPPLRALPRRIQRASRAKKNPLSIGRFAQMGLFGQDGRDELKPLRRDTGSQRTSRMRKNHEDVDTSDGDEELARLFDSDDDLDTVIPPSAAEDIPDDPDYNPDLSDSDMSYSPTIDNGSHSLQGLLPSDNSTHPYNIASTNAEIYFHDTLRTNTSIQSAESYQYYQPAAYWKWPVTHQSTNLLDKDTTQTSNIRSSARRLTSTHPINTMSRISVRLLKAPRLPHISWQQRRIDATEQIEKENLITETKNKELEVQKREHAERMMLNMDKAMKSAVANVAIDSKDGFIRIKGTRKRQCAGVDRDVDRPRRKYTWKKGKPPIRGKARIEHEAKIAAERQIKEEHREARHLAGLPVADSEDEPTPEPLTPETRPSIKRPTGPKGPRTAQSVAKKETKKKVKIKKVPVVDTDSASE